MADQESPKSGFDKWKDTIDKAVGDPRWNAWDCEIQNAVSEYNRHLSGKGGYKALDWLLIKAMLWVESGAHHSEWRTKPMQIGVTGDPGLKALLSGGEGGDLILPAALKGQLTMTSVIARPEHNIRAGIGYLLMRMAKLEYREAASKDATEHQVTVRSGDSLDRIAKANGTTVETLRAMNRDTHMLRPGQVLKYRKASIQRQITGWRAINTGTIAQRYNGGGDPRYAEKLDYALAAIQRGPVAACAQ